MQTKSLEKVLYKSDSEEIPDNFMGAAVWINEEDDVQHAGIFVKYGGVGKLLHFTSTDVLFEEVDESKIYLIKEFKFLAPGITSAFYTQCEIVENKAKPKFGFYYTGSRFDSNGNVIGVGKYHEYMTCVGFCLNFLNYFLEDNEEFIKYDDWDNASLAGIRLAYFKKFFDNAKKENPNLDISDFMKNMRRIVPLEYITASFSKSIPVPKTYTDKQAPRVYHALMQTLS